MKEKTGTAALNIFEALTNISRAAKAIGKRSENEQQGFFFRGIEAVMNHLHPVFAEHGVVILPEVVAERTEERVTKHGGNLIYRVLTIRFRFVSRDSSEVSCTVIGEGMDSGDKATNKAMAVALKYALSQMLLLPYDEIDPDATTQPESKAKDDTQPQGEQKSESKAATTRKSAKQRFFDKIAAARAAIGDDKVSVIMNTFAQTDDAAKISSVKVATAIVEELNREMKKEGK